jgi:hypothetical protein
LRKKFTTFFSAISDSGPGRGILNREQKRPHSLETPGDAAFYCIRENLRLDAVDPLHHSRNLPAGFTLMNDAFGGSLINDWNGHFYGRSGGFLILLLNGLVNSLENAFDSGLSAGVSHSSFFILARPFQG